MAKITNFVYNIAGSIMFTENPQNDFLLNECENVMNELFARCVSDAPNYGISEDVFKGSLRKTAGKYLFANELNHPTAEEIKTFLNELQTADLFLALACAAGNERAWWEFDHHHRAYLERVARHLASSEADAQDVVDTVYVELYGTRVVEGERVSKFATYSGRGSLRGWLRTVIWHALVDLHRTSHDEVSLDEMTETVGEGYTHSTFAEPSLGGEQEMLDQMTRERYRRATLSAIENAFAALEDHEKLLLLFYHVENMKLREIAQIAASPSSPLRDWFQRKSATRLENPESRIHESTIMRWLEKTYAKVLKTFRHQLTAEANFKEEEMEICLELATQDLASPNLYRNLMTTHN